MSIVSVTSKDGRQLYVLVRAVSGAQEEATRAQLQLAAAKRTAEELLSDGYYFNPGCASLALPCEECRRLVIGKAA
jgi:hypothetical protein